jgi:hypothetical protein
MRVGMVCRQRQDRSRHGVVTVREWLSAIIEVTYRPMTVASGPRGIRRGGDITAASLGCPESSFPVDRAAAAWCLWQLS